MPANGGKLEAFEALKLGHKLSALTRVIQVLGHWRLSIPGYNIQDNKTDHCQAESM